MKLFYNASFYTMKNKADIASAVLADDNGIIKEVFYKRVPTNIKSCEKINLNGTYVFPGFIDTHTHTFTGGLYSFAGDLSKAKSLTDVIEILKSTEPVCSRIMSWQFDETKIKEKRFPTAEELDKLFPDIPVYVRRVDGHSCVINSYALNTMLLKRSPS